jgi:hypothetical protein
MPHGSIFTSFILILCNTSSFAQQKRDSKITQSEIVGVWQAKTA